MSNKPSVSLFCILARKAAVGVVFRKSPAKWVQLLRWDLTNDHFEKGQWFKGRIYERYCDLSPSGRLLIYWAGDHKRPPYNWTAISKPPYVTALQLWENVGGTGGGMFVSERQVILSSWSIFSKGGPLPENFAAMQYVGPPDTKQGYILESRLLRDGWKQIEPETPSIAQYKWNPGQGEIQTTFLPPNIKQRTMNANCLEMRTLGLQEVGGPTHVVEYSVLDQDGALKLDLGRTDWADFDKNGDLLYAKSGCVFRLSKDLIGTGAATKLIDLTDARFEELETPEEFKHW